MSKTIHTSKTIYEVRTCKPEDIIGYDDELEALRSANEINIWHMNNMARNGGDIYEMMVATVTEI